MFGSLAPAVEPRQMGAIMITAAMALTLMTVIYVFILRKQLNSAEDAAAALAPHAMSGFGFVRWIKIDDTSTGHERLTVTLTMHYYALGATQCPRELCVAALDKTELCNVRLLGQDANLPAGAWREATYTGTVFPTQREQLLGAMLSDWGEWYTRGPFHVRIGVEPPRGEALEGFTKANISIHEGSQVIQSVVVANWKEIPEGWRTDVYGRFAETRFADEVYEMKATLDRLFPQSGMPAPTPTGQEAAPELLDRTMGERVRTAFKELGAVIRDKVSGGGR